jgi:hypothetical protein
MLHYLYEDLKLNRLLNASYGEKLGDFLIQLNLSLKDNQKSGDFLFNKDCWHLRKMGFV